MSLSRRQLDTIITAYSFSTATNILLVINHVTIRLQSRRERPGSSPPSSTSLRREWKHTFRWVPALQLLASIVAEAIFLVLSLKHGHEWPTFLLSSIVLMNVGREVSRAPWSSWQSLQAPVFMGSGQLEPRSKNISPRLLDGHPAYSMVVLDHRHCLW